MRFAILMSLTLTTVACTGDDTDVTDTDPQGATFAFTMTGTGYDPHAAKGVHIALTDDAGALVDTRLVDITDGGWTYEATDALAEGAAYSVSWYADMSEDPGCDAFAQDGTTVVDHVWKKAIPAVTADVTMTHAHGTDFDPNGCDAFAE